MLIITGTGRSGTSLVARLCQRMGYDMGAKWYDCIDAGLEHPRVAGISRYIHLRGADDKVVRAIRTTRLPVAKDPRLCLYPAAMEAWAANRNDLKLVVLLRRIDHVALSLHRRKPWFARTDPLLAEETVEETAHRRARAFYECLQIAAAHAVPIRILSYPEFLDRYDLVHEALVTFGGLRWEYEAGRKTWDRLVDKSKVHVQ